MPILNGASAWSGKCVSICDECHLAHRHTGCLQPPHQCVPSLYLTQFPIPHVFHYVAIASGYYLGTSLSPEAKTYRLLADVLNDAAIITDTLSPHLATLSLSPRFPFLVPTPAAGAASPLRIVALCASGALRALCGAVAGGSKAALTVHFASAGVRPGDLGDLNAKDGSKETVLALLGMLVRFH